MPLKRDQLKVLLLQIREDEETMLEEFYEFVQFSGLSEDQFTKLSTYETADFEPDIMEDYDVLFVGGSSDASVLDPEEFKFIHNCRRLMRYCYDKNIPVFASCFGFQVAIEELGGEVILDKENMEMGIYPIHLTEAGKQDPLTHDLPSTFWGVSGHKERANHIPEDCECLAYSELCPYHIFKFKNKPFYGFQFHPEVTRDIFLNRVRRYQERYLEDEETLQRIIDKSIHETPESNSLVKKFIDRVVLRETCDVGRIKTTH